MRFLLRLHFKMSLNNDTADSGLPSSRENEDLQATQMAPLNTDEDQVYITKSQAYNLYTSHFLSTWNIRTYEFAAVSPKCGHRMMIQAKAETDLMTLDHFHTSCISEYSSPSCYSVSSLFLLSDDFLHQVNSRPITCANHFSVAL